MLYGFLEELVTLRKKLSIRAQLNRSRDRDGRAMESLETVKKHRPIALRQNIHAQFHDKVGSDPHQMRVEGGVMQLAQSEAVRDDR